MKDIPDPIKEVLKQKNTAASRAERIFLSHLPTVFANNLNAWADVRKRVADALGVAIHQVLVCGSAMIGYSFVKNRPFRHGSSDLDIAVISATLFVRCLEEANRDTRSYRDNTSFPRRDDINVLDSFLDTAARRGMVRLDLMPKCIFKTDVEGKLRKATIAHSAMFREINCAIYCSEFLFLQKQAGLVEIAEKQL